MWHFQHCVFLLCIIAAISLAQEQQGITCETDDGMTCRPGTAAAVSSVCGVDTELCQADKSSLYSHGGSAQAYVANAPVKSVVCEEKGSKHKVATWPISRSTRGSAPKLLIRANFWSCTSTENECCCENLVENIAKAEVWQARPDGTYSSLQSGNGDCRATVVPQNDGRLEFTTMAPGSTGALGGLGPSGWDVAPYGQPTVHMLLTTENHEPLLIHVPIVPHGTTLEERSFWGGDFRGHASKRRAKANAFKVKSWEVVGDAEIQLELDVFLTRGSSSKDLAKDLCPSLLYGTPGSFFVEPIAVCAPSLLNFFPL